MDDHRVVRLENRRYCRNLPLIFSIVPEFPEVAFVALEMWGKTQETLFLYFHLIDLVQRPYFQVNPSLGLSSGYCS